MSRIQWKEDQATFALNSLLHRLTTNFESVRYRIEHMHNDGKKYNFTKRKEDGPTELEIMLYSRSKNMWMGVYTGKGHADGSFSVSFLPWKHRAYKKLRKQIISCIETFEKAKEKKSELERKMYDEQNRDTTFEEAFKKEILDQEVDKIIRD